MVLFKCSMCGNTLDVSDDETFVECDSCGMIQEVPIRHGGNSVHKTGYLDESRSADTEFKSTSDEEQYQYACNLMRIGEYDEACDIFFTNIAHYKDSKKKYHECLNLKLQKTYNLALKQMDAGLYLDAAKNFQSLGDYQDADIKVEECRRLEGKKQESESLKEYNDALSEMKNGSYARAAAMFKSLDSFLDSRELYQQCQYQYGLLLKDTDHRAAISVFDSLGNYKDAKQQSRDVKYRDAKLEVNLLYLDHSSSRHCEERFKNVADILFELGDYKDSKRLLKECAKYDSDVAQRVERAERLERARRKREQRAERNRQKERQYNLDIDDTSSGKKKIIAASVVIAIIAIICISVVFIISNLDSQPAGSETTPLAILEARVYTDEIILTHMGGDALPMYGTAVMVRSLDGKKTYASIDRIGTSGYLYAGDRVVSEITSKPRVGEYVDVSVVVDGKYIVFNKEVQVGEY